MLVDLKELKRLAEAATADEWDLVAAEYELDWELLAKDGSLIADLYTTGEENARYIAAASPANVLRLMAEVERLRDSYRQASDALFRIGELMGLDNTEAPVTFEDVCNAVERFVDQSDIR